MKKAILWLGKAIFSAVIAAVIANAFCYFYYNLPVHYTNDSGATDYYWDQNHISMRGMEGFSFTKTDENGFVNTYPEKKDEIDVLVMGSSHTEGFNLNWNQNFTYLLNQKFHENGDDKYAYSIGTSGHALIRCLKNLDAAVQKYQPKDCVVIETSLIQFNLEELQQLNSNEYASLPSYNAGLIANLQKIDLFRLVYYQANNFMKKDISKILKRPMPLLKN